MRCFGPTGLLLVLAAFDAGAAATAQQAAEREAIRTERAAVEARYQAAAQACRDRFIVASCLEEQQALRRAALAQLRQRELALDDAERRAEADQAARRVQAKEAEAARRASAPARPPIASAPRQAPQASRSGAPQAEAQAESQARRQERAAEEAAAAAARAEAHQRRASEAEAHRQAVERRNAERAAKGKPPAAPLPVPPEAREPDS